MPVPLPQTPAGGSAWHALLDDPGAALLALDFDGTLAPIVDDPAAARALPEVGPVLARLSAVLRMVGIVTGRPAATASELGGFADVAGFDRLLILGQYGRERWDAASGEVRTAPPPPGLETVRQELPGLLEAAQAPDAYVEDKGSAVAVHTRRMADPAGAFDRLRGPLAALAETSGLRLEPGRLVLELRPPGVDKGGALRGLVDELGAQTVVYAGDDLGDLAAYDAVDELRSEGVAGLLVCAGSTEVAALAERADLVVDGPHGVAAWLAGLAELTAQH